MKSGQTTPEDRFGGLPRPPFWIIAALLIFVVASWLPLALLARARMMKTSEPRVHYLQDMENQPKYKAEDASPVFADGRAMRPKIPGTVARGELMEDDHYYRGYKESTDASGKASFVFLKGFPQQIDVSEQLLKRGQERFNIYCSVCHGLDGYGNGQINARAQDLQEPKWVQPANLHSDTVRARPEGHIFNTITNGIRNMPGYASQIPVNDRWAIVAYVRALQLSQHVPANQVSGKIK